MTKRHFIELADAIRAHNHEVATDTYVTEKEFFDNAHIATIADFCASTNPRFNRERWLDYIAGKCGPSGGPVKTAKGAL